MQQPQRDPDAMDVDAVAIGEESDGVNWHEQDGLGKAGKGSASCADDRAISDKLNRNKVEEEGVGKGKGGRTGFVQQQ